MTPDERATIQAFHLRFEQAVPHNRALGLRVIAVEHARSHFLLPYAEHLVGNPETGVLHGGAISAAMDAACGAAVFQALPQLDPAWRLALVTGFLGALTTFSSFSAEVVTMLQQQRYLLAAGTTGLHLGGSLLMTLLGLQTVALALASRP